MEDPPIEEVIERVFAQESAVSGLVELYRQQFRTTLASMLQYRASLVIWLIGHVLEPLVYLVVWSAVSRIAAAAASAGTAPAEFAAYFIVLMLVNHVTYTWIMYEYEYRVRHGTLSFALLRPVHPIHSDIADNISSKLITLPAHPRRRPPSWRWSSDPSFHFAPWAVAAFVPALLLAFLVRFLMEWTLALAAFWTTRVSAVNQIYFVADALPLRPDGAALAPPRAGPGRRPTSCPSAGPSSFPVELLLGRLDCPQALTGSACRWPGSALCLVLLRLVWRAGVRVYSAVGA